MKKFTITFLLISCAFIIKAQVCNFSYHTSPASTLVDFFPDTSYSPTTYYFVWNYNDGTVDTANGPFHVFNVMSGAYVCCDIHEIATDSLVCSSCDSIFFTGFLGGCSTSFTVDPLFPATIYFQGFNFNPYTYVHWNFGDGTSAYTINATHVYTSPGTYNAVMFVTDTNGLSCGSSVNVVIYPTNNCSIQNNTTLLNPMQVDYAVGISGPNIVVNWDFGDNTFGAGDSTSHTYLYSGTYNVCVNIVQNGNVICNSCKWIIVGGNWGSCPISYWDTIPVNTKRFFFQPSTSNSTVNWDFGDGSVGVGSLIDHTYLSAGPYTVCIDERDSLNNPLCSNCVNILVGNGPLNCQASFLSSTQGNTVYFVDQSITPLNNTSFSWDFGDGGVSTLRFPQHYYASMGYYNTCLTITSGICVNQFCSPIIIDTSGNWGSVCHAYFAIIQMSPYQVSIVNLSTGPFLNYLWDFGDGTTDTQPFPYHFFNSTGDYNLCLSVSDTNGCTSSFCDTLHVDSLGFIYRGMTGFALNVVSPSQITGLSDIKSLQSLNVYPNPANSILNISSEQNQLSFRILSILGTEVLSGNLSGSENMIDFQKISSGSYLLEVIFFDGSRSYKSVVKN